jgi:hypothetical protein
VFLGEIFFIELPTGLIKNWIFRGIQQLRNKYELSDFQLLSFDGSA